MTFYFHYRLLLAALHFNSNGSREVAQTSDGELCYAFRFPRFRKGGWVVRPVKEMPSYGKLFQSLLKYYCVSVHNKSITMAMNMTILIPHPAYASALMESLRVEYSRSPQALHEHSTVLPSSAPLPLSRTLQKTNNDEAVAVYLARHSRFNTGH